MIYWIVALLFSSTSSGPHKPLTKVYTGLFLTLCALSVCFALSSWQYEAIAVPAPPIQTTLLQNNRVDEGSAFLLAESGDLDAIKQRGQLRILVQKPKLRAARLISSEKKLITQYAKEHGLETDWIEVDEAQQLLSHLRLGRGDIVLTADSKLANDMHEDIQLTLPWGVSQEQVIGRSDTGRIRSIDELNTRQVAIKRSSPVWDELQALAKINPSMGLVEIPESESIKSILQHVTSAQYDVTIVDNLAVESLLPEFLNLEVSLNVTDASTVSWAVRSTANDLQASLN
ncbi:MAG: membrane-bound lytic murein transglycosylase MltF, partial [Gammaproteobacteria bacterium]